MEDKNFQWLGRLLSTRKTHLNVLETMFFHGDALEFWVYTDEFGTVRKRSTGEEGINLLADGISYYFNRLRKNPRKTFQNAVACYSVWKGVRLEVDTQIGEELIGKREGFARSSFLQEFKDLRGPRKYLYTFRTRYAHTRGYSTTSFRVKDLQKEKETSSRLIHKMRDACQIVLSAVEHVKLKRVIDLELEFMQDEDGDLWLMGCYKCRVAVPAFCLQAMSLLTPERSVESSSTRKLKSQYTKQKTKMYEKDDESTKATLQEGKYVFKRGQLRNQNSNLNSPIRINTPISSKDSSRSEGTEESGEKTSFDVQAVKAMLWNSFRPAKSDRFNNSNFQEMLMRNFVKRMGMPPRAADNKEDLQRYMESVLYPSEPDLFTRTISNLNKYRLSVFHAEDLPSPGANISASSDSALSDDSSSSQLAPTDLDKLPVLTPKASNSRLSRIRLSKMSATHSAKQSPTLRSPRGAETARVFRKTGLNTPEKWDQLTRNTIKSQFLVPVLTQRRKKAALTPRS